MSQSPTKRNPLLTAPNSQDIMTGARRRQASQNAGTPVSHNDSTPSRQHASEPAKRKFTFYLAADLGKALKSVAFHSDTNQSQVVEDALKEYLAKRPVAGAV